MPENRSAVRGTLDAKIRIRHMDGAASALGFDRVFEAIDDYIRK